MKMAGVNDPVSLAREIGQIYIGSMKLYVNVPRFGKEDRRERWEKEGRPALRRFEVRGNEGHPTALKGNTGKSRTDGIAKENTVKSGRSYKQALKSGKDLDKVKGDEGIGE